MWPTSHVGLEMVCHPHPAHKPTATNLTFLRAPANTTRTACAQLEPAQEGFSDNKLGNLQFPSPHRGAILLPLCNLLILSQNLDGAELCSSPNI